MSNLPEVYVEDQAGVPPAITTITLTTTPFSKEPLNFDSLKYGLKPTPPSEPRPDREKEGSAKGKREAAGPIVTTSDEDEPPTPPESPRESRGAALSSTFHDHDYEPVNSPGGSSTSSGPTYVRPPGFAFHAHSIAKPKSKKKKTTYLIAIDDGLTPKIKEQLPLKTKPKREPLPMRMRALPQSFWQQPNNPHNASPAQNFSRLPPLVTRDGEEVPEIRPVSPVQEDPEEKPVKHKSQHDKTASMSSTNHSKVNERKITVANTDLLFKLFENVEKDYTKSSNKRVNGNNTTFGSLHKPEALLRGETMTIRRGRPRKMQVSSKQLLSGDDPCLVDCVSEKLFPTLNREQRKAMLLHGGYCGGNTLLQVVTIREGDRSVTLPSLSVEQNYSQMLSELVMHI